MIGTDSKFIIVYNSFIPQYKSALSALEGALIKKNISYEKVDIEDLKEVKKCDFVFVIGGDGTILRVAKFFAVSKTPVFGLNIGRLGFLSQSKEQDIEFALSKILDNNCTIEKRLMLKSGDKIALNDFVIKGVTCSRTAKFQLKINDKFVCEYIADGLIISTPTGSTAYGLSAGGPVIYPMLDALVVVPICPHTLTARPLVIPSDEKISVSSADRTMPLTMAIDGDEAGVFNNEIVIEKSDLFAHLALIDDEFYNVLRNKLHWGVAPEND